MKKIIFGLVEKSLSFFRNIGISKKTPGAEMVYNFLYKKSWPYGDIIEIQGSKMFVNSKEESLVMRKTLEGYAHNLIHERATTDLFRRTVRPKDVVLDLGANIGYFSLLAAKIVGHSGKVFSFEPEPRNFRYLTKNIEINKYSQIKAFQKAVSDKNGKVKLFVCDYDTGHHTINQYGGIEAYSRGRDTHEMVVEIDAVALDSFLADKTDRVDIIKMDVEGAEYLALMGMDKILKNNHGIKMFIEFFPLLIEKMGNSPQEFIKKLLEEYGFSIFVIPDDYNASNEKIIKINNVDEIMKFRISGEDHINLFLTRQ